MMRKGEIVKDELGNHFRVLKDMQNGKIKVESVATKEIFYAPADELFPSDREAF